MTAANNSKPACGEASNIPATLDIQKLADSTYLREVELIRSKRNPTAPLPFSSASLWRMVSDGRFPRPHKLSDRVTAWTAGSVKAYLNKCAEA